jgi:hypothetical protein
MANRTIKVGTTVVSIEDGTEIITFTTKMDVDADGANAQHGADDLHPGKFAYRLDNKGMDRLSSAGYPKGGWTNVLVRDPKDPTKPFADADGNLFSKTSLCLDTTLPDTDARKWVDADFFPYIVLPPEVISAVGRVVLGCYAVVRNIKDGRSVMAVVADVGPRGKIGEASIATALAVSMPNASPLNGDDRPIYSYEVHPGIPASLKGTIFPLQHFG